jgi:hypothetical protein
MVKPLGAGQRLAEGFTLSGPLEPIGNQETIMTDKVEPQPVVIVEPKPTLGHPDAPDGYPTPGHKMAAEQEEAEDHVDYDHLGRIEELAHEVRNATPSGANAVSDKILSHVHALRNPEAYKEHRVYTRKMKVERAKEARAMDNPDKTAGKKEAEASRERQMKLDEEHAKAVVTARENQQKAANTARDANATPADTKPDPVVQAAPSRQIDEQNRQNQPLPSPSPKPTVMA